MKLSASWQAQLGMVMSVVLNACLLQYLVCKGLAKAEQPSQGSLK